MARHTPDLLGGRGSLCSGVIPGGHTEPSQLECAVRSSNTVAAGLPNGTADSPDLRTLSRRGQGYEASRLWHWGTRAVGHGNNHCQTFRFQKDIPQLACMHSGRGLALLSPGPFSTVHVTQDGWGQGCEQVSWAAW